MEQILTRLIQDFEQGKMSRRQLVQGLMTAVAGASALVGTTPEAVAQQTPGQNPNRGSGFTPQGRKLAPPLNPLNPPGVTTALTGVGVAHISFDVKDCGKAAYFYADLFGLRVFQGPNTNEAHCQCGDTYLTFRNSDKPNTPYVQHIAIAVLPWDNYQDSSIKGSKAAEAELRKRGIKVGDGDPMVDAEGFPVQIIGPYYRTKN